MSLFGFGDITFNKQSGAKFGPLSALEGTQYEKNTFRYPADVGNYDKGHYMVIYIREQRETLFKGQPATDAIPGIPKTAAAKDSVPGGRLSVQISSKTTVLVPSEMVTVAPLTKLFK